MKKTQSILLSDNSVCKVTETQFNYIIKYFDEQNWEADVPFPLLNKHEDKQVIKILKQLKMETKVSKSIDKLLK